MCRYAVDAGSTQLLPAVSVSAVLTRPIVVLLATLALFSTAAARIVSEAEADAIAGSFCTRLWGESRDNGRWLYDDPSGRPAVYLCERQLVYETEGHTSVTVMVGARTDMPPVLLYHFGEAPDAAHEAALRTAAGEALLQDGVRKTASIYCSPLDLWHEYEADGRRVLVSLRDLSVTAAGTARAEVPFSPGPAQQTRFEEQWSCYLSGDPPLLLDGEHRIGGVPDWDWHYGCAPTAAANVLSYWDRNGYDLLVDTVLYKVPDPIGKGNDSLPNVSTELAQAMSTDTIVSGLTAMDSIAVGITAVCADPKWGNNYRFTSWLSWNDHDLLISEINSNRPGVLGLVGHPEYGNHAVTFCGWGPPNSDWIVVHDAWAGTPQDKVINYYYGAPVATIPIIPPTPRSSDVAVSAIVSPEQQLLPGMVAPQTILVNQGPTAALARVFFSIGRTDVTLGGNCYCDSAEVVLEPGTRLARGFPLWEAALGSYVARCSVYVAGDEQPENDVKVTEFCVADSTDEDAGAGVGPSTGRLRAFPNPVRATASGGRGLAIRTTGWVGPAAVALYAVDGRCLLSRDVEDPRGIELPDLGAGVYLLRLERPGARASVRITVTR